MPDDRFQGVDVPVPEFAGDDGSADARLRELLGGGSPRDVVAALAGARLLVPVLAVLDSVDVGDGLPQEKDSHLATVSVVQPDGRRGLLAFTGVDSMTRWRPDARPVAAAAARVAAAAIAEGAAAVLVDAAGPSPFALAGSALRAVADGRSWCPPHQDQDVIAAVAAALAGTPGLAGHELVDGDPHGADLLVLLVPAAGTDLDSLADDAGRRLGADPLVSERAGAVALGVSGDEAVPPPS